LRQNFAAKERKEHEDRRLYSSFFAIFVILRGNLFLVAACRAVCISVHPWLDHISESPGCHFPPAGVSNDRI
jgi:hypothetical protein